jgi:hypothetical protein
LEGQLVQWIRDFKPDERLIALIVKAVEADRPAVDPTKARRGELLGQLPRLQDLYVLGDLPRAQYVMRRQAIEEEVQRLGAPADPGIDRAKALLGDFESFWELETEPSERRKLLLSLFEQVWAQGGRIVAVQPHEDFLPYFQAASRCRTGRGNGRGAESGPDTRTYETRPCLEAHHRTEWVARPTPQNVAVVRTVVVWYTCLHDYIRPTRP